MVNQAIKKEIDLDNILDKIIIARAFTFYQLSNILIHQLPKMTKEIGNHLQIIIVDLFDTLVSSSTISKMKDYRNNGYSPSYNALQENVNIVNQMIDVLISLSIKYFVILTCNDCENTINISIGSKFSNAVKIKHFPDKSKNEKNTFKIELLIYNTRSRNNVIVKRLSPLS